MKLIICVFALLVANAKAVDDCPAYFKYITGEYEKCLPSKVDVAQVLGKLAEVAKSEATVEQYQQIVSSFCKTFENVPECFESTSIDKSACYYDPPMQDFRNALKSFIILNKYGCANNGKRYLDMVDGDGPTCYTQNKENDDCFINAKTKYGVENMQAYQDGLICKTKKADAECLSKYDGCSNKNIKVFLAELNDAVQAEFECN